MAQLLTSKFNNQPIRGLENEKLKIMYTKNHDLLGNIYSSIGKEFNIIEPTINLVLTIKEATGLYGCIYYNHNGGAIGFDGEINITKLLDDNITSDEFGVISYPEYCNGKYNNRGRETLKHSVDKITYNGVEYDIDIVEYFGQIKDDKKGYFKGFKLVNVFLPQSLCNILEFENLNQITN